MKTIKNNKGITLIALVITIIILLILAGVSISSIGGNRGLIKKANEAQEKTEEAKLKEQIRIAIETASMTRDGSIDVTELQNEFSKIGGTISSTEYPIKGTVGGMEVTINEDASFTVAVGNGAGGSGSGGAGSGGTIAGTKYNTETTITVGTDTVKVPGKATISGIAEECESVDKGIVIYIIPENETVADWNADANSNGIKDVQEKYDQFVWVPVKNAVLDLSGNSTALSSEANIKSAVSAEITAGRYPMAIKKADGNYLGVLYQFSEDSSTNTVKVEPYSSWTPLTTLAFREPAYLINSNYADGSSYNTVGITQTPDSLQSEFNTMVNRVNSNKGFWVGRYETSNMKGGSSKTDNSYDATQQIDVVRGAIKGLSGGNINWYRMYAQQKNYSKLALGTSTTVTSSMIWGSQWDQIMIWMKEEPNERVTTNGKYYVTNSVGYGNYGNISGATEYDIQTSTSEPAKTGSSDYFRVKNIYDLAGNVYEWSLEANSTDYRVFRRR